jgi:hypothetical protein
MPEIQIDKGPDLLGCRGAQERGANVHPEPPDNLAHGLRLQMTDHAIEVGRLEHARKTIPRQDAQSAAGAGRFCHGPGIIPATGTKKQS